MINRRSLVSAAALGGLGLVTGCTSAPSYTNQQADLVAASESALRAMLADPETPLLLAYLERSKAVAIFPNMLRGGFVVGGEIGDGVLLARMADGSWGYPVFLGSGTGSVGLQIGAQVSDVVLAVVTEDGLNALIDRRVTLGIDASLAALNAGAGVDARTGLDFNSDMYAFSRNRGLFAGGSIEGAVVRPSEPDNRAYYGTQTATTQNIIASQYRNPQADPLRMTLPPAVFG